jgi:hypothetical protein
VGGCSFVGVRAAYRYPLRSIRELLEFDFQVQVLQVRTIANFSASRATSKE